MINTVAIPNCELIINMHLFYQLDYVQLLFILVLDILLPCRELMVHIYYWTVQLYFIIIYRCIFSCYKSKLPFTIVILYFIRIIKFAIFFDMTLIFFTQTQIYTHLNTKIFLLLKK